MKKHIFTCIPSTPLMPTPISASWIMPTSFAPSPIASVVLPVMDFTSLVTCISSSILSDYFYLSNNRAWKSSWNSHSVFDSPKHDTYNSLLFGRRATTYNSSTTNCKMYKAFYQLPVQSKSQGLAINYQTKLSWTFSIYKRFSVLYLLFYTFKRSLIIIIIIDSDFSTIRIALTSL